MVMVRLVFLFFEKFGGGLIDSFILLLTFLKIMRRSTKKAADTTIEEDATEEDCEKMNERFDLDIILHADPVRRRF